MSGFHKKEIMDISNINKRKKKIWLLLALFMIIILTAVICHHCRKPPWPPKEIWFEEDFRHGLEGWEYLDTTGFMIREWFFTTLFGSAEKFTLPHT
jgi:hypothetical protein